MYRTKKRLKTALCNGMKNRGKEQAENKPIFSTPNRLAKGRVQVFYILQAEEIGAYGRPRLQGVADSPKETATKLNKNNDYENACKHYR